jgi:hypothetical protein
MSDADAFVGQWAGMQYVKGAHADGRPHHEPPTRHVLTFKRDDEGGVFLDTDLGRVPLYVLGPTAAVVQACELSGQGACGPTVARVAGGAVHRIGNVLAFSWAVKVNVEGSTDTLTAFFVFKGRRVVAVEDATSRPAN